VPVRFEGHQVAMSEAATDQVIITLAEYEELLAYRAGPARTRPPEVRDMIRAGATPLRAWRRYRGMTQAHLADNSAITQGHLSELESNSGKTPNLLTARFLARALHVSLDVL
jgi:DNA-binding XRE family transcriptional regulator